MWQTWLIISGVCLILEIMTTGFLIFWFAIGALFAMIFSFFVDSIILQTTIFLICSTILLFATKPFVAKFQKNTPNYKNISSIEGDIGKVTKEINPIEGTGQIKISGEIWSAKSVDGSIISEGENVKVEKLEGVKAIVKKVN